ncbi:hypothetical protein IV203_038742 [Nitzschia inconspicua]|uniref:Uncharacterized protein n=1 Tax=Nitzschia inconspicua TaxID=303405 RepID=A0A9K3LPG1_9STRA|nr:hypothetical protein IV203_038742 [Nitzschia inconspicua]
MTTTTNKPNSLQRSNWRRSRRFTTATATAASTIQQFLGRLVLCLVVVDYIRSSTTTATIKKYPSNLWILPTAQAWEWSDFTTSGSTKHNDGNNNDLSTTNQPTWLSRPEISAMRVRDIKRRLARTHGYGADELAKMLDKQELISALWGEEYKEYQKVKSKRQRQVIIEGIWTALIGVVILVGWPLWKHVYEVAMVNWVVYTDRKLLEIQKCRDYKSMAASIGVVLMIAVDVLQLWLSVSVLLSWVMTSKYFFPMPTLAIRPAQFMGEKVAHGPMGRYGMNVAPMAITWTLRFVRTQVESYTAKALSNAYQQQKKESRANETEEERAARKAARKAAKRLAKEEAAQKELERQQQQAQFRKEMADQASQQLFGRQQQQQQPPRHPQQHQEQGKPQRSPFEEDEKHQQSYNDDDDYENDHEFLSDEDEDNEDEDEMEAKRQFEADLQHVDINDLD